MASPWLRRAMFGAALGGLSGAMCVGCAVPFNLWPLAVVAFAPFAIACCSQSWVVAGCASLSHGLMIALGCLHFVLPALHAKAGVSWPVAALLWFGLAFGQGWTPLLAAALARWLRRAWSNEWLAVAGGWVIAEWLTPVTFPWPAAILGQAFPVWLQLSELAGPLGVSFWIVAVGSGIGVGVFDWRMGWRLRTGPLLSALLIGSAATAAGWFLMRRAQSHANQCQPVRIGVVQAAHKPISATDHRDTLQRYREISLDLVSRAGPLDLLAWPETILLAPLDREDAKEYLRNYVRTDRREGHQSRLLSTPVLLGLNLERTTDEGAIALTNSVLLLDADGDIAGSYDKHVLVPIGERPLAVPLPWSRGWEIMAPATRYQSGVDLAPLLLGAHRIGVLICYEDLLPAYVRGHVAQVQPELLVSVSSDAWFDGDTARKLHFMLASLRAVEQRRYILRVTNDGLSGLIAPDGKAVWTAPCRETLGDVAVARWCSEATAYSRFGDAPICGLIAFGALLGVLRRTRGSRPRPGETPIMSMH